MLAVRDPAGHCGVIQPDLPRLKASALLENGSHIAARALEFERRGDDDKAICCWRAIFGPRFPAPPGGCPGEDGEEDGGEGTPASGYDGCDYPAGDEDKSSGDDDVSAPVGARRGDNDTSQDGDPPPTGRSDRGDPTVHPNSGTVGADGSAPPGRGGVRGIGGLVPPPIPRRQEPSHRRPKDEPQG
jgi:hypothetical protein